MSFLDHIRSQMTKIAAQKDTARQKSLTKGTKMASAELAAIVASSEVAEKHQILSMEGKLLETFHASHSVSNLLNIAKFIKVEIPTCKSVIFLRIVDKGLGFRLYCRDTVFEQYETYRIADFQCVEEVVRAKTPVVTDDVSKKQLSILVQWKPLFGFIPDLTVGIPLMLLNRNVGAIAAISLRNKLPRGFMDKKLPELQELLEMIVPYAFNIQGIVDCHEAISAYDRIMDSIQKIEKVISTHSPAIALTQIGTEIMQLAGTKGLIIFSVDEGDNILRKFHTSFGTKGKVTCPDKKLHSQIDIPITDSNIAALAWVVTNRREMKINSPADLEEYGIIAKQIHSIGNCNTKSMLLCPVIDYSGEHGLVIELSDKAKLFSQKEFQSVLILCQHSACLLTSTILLDRKEKNFRRRNIINEVLCSIKFVKPAKVEQFITQHRKTSHVFKGQFDDFDLSIRGFPEQDMAGIALEIFYELGIVKDFKMRRSVLVRFILSVQQGYGQLPYHNWYHAVSVAHYAYLLIRKLNLVELGHLSKLEAFALVVSALTHDVDHRGTNNQFQSYTNSEIYKLYACEDSVMERHHLAIALAILHREDCNILEMFNDSDYKYFVELLTWNIIATDISKHLSTRSTLFAEARAVNPKQRKMARLCLFMTAADLCDNCKKWDENLPTVKGILQEFFNQGDMERRLGFTPIPMMDRNVAYIPLIEYKFTKYIVAPVYIFLASVYDLMKPCVENIKKNEDLWTLSTKVFDKYIADVDQLDILDLPDLKEEELMKISLGLPMDVVKKRKFSLPPPPSIPTVANLTEKRSGQIVENKSTKSLPLLRAHSTDEGLDDVDTGQSKRSRFIRFLCCCRTK